MQDIVEWAWEIYYFFAVLWHCVYDICICACVCMCAGTWWCKCSRCPTGSSTSASTPAAARRRTGRWVACCHLQRVCVWEIVNWLWEEQLVTACGMLHLVRWCMQAWCRCYWMFLSWFCLSVSDLSSPLSPFSLFLLGMLGGANLAGLMSNPGFMNMVCPFHFWCMMVEITSDWKKLSAVKMLEREINGSFLQLRSQFQLEAFCYQSYHKFALPMLLSMLLRPCTCTLFDVW